MKRLDNISTRKSESSGMYVYLISFVAAVGGFRFGYDLNVIAGAQIYLTDYFHLDAKGVGFAVGSALIGCMIGPILGGGGSVTSSAERDPSLRPLSCLESLPSGQPFPRLWRYSISSE